MQDFSSLRTFVLHNFRSRVKHVNTSFLGIFSSSQATLLYFYLVNCFVVYETASINPLQSA